jgi:hypothetical protein
MMAALLPTARTVHALHQLTTQQTPRPSGNWEVRGSIPNLPSLPRYLSPSCSGAFELLLSDECNFVTLSVPLDNRVLTKSVYWVILLNRGSRYSRCKSHTFNNFLLPHGLFRVKIVEEYKQAFYFMFPGPCIFIYSNK